jgi:hypothetical protein
VSTDSEPGQQQDPTAIRARRFIFRVAKWIIAVAVAVGLYFAARSAVAQWHAEGEKLRAQIAAIEQQLADTQDVAERDELQRVHAQLVASVPRLANLRWERIALSSLLYAMGLVPPGFVLRRALLSLGQRPRLGTAIMAQLIGHVGKYVPGKAMVVILRAGVLSRDRVSAVPATISIFLETFLMMAVGAAFAGIVVLWLPVPRWITLTAVSLSVVASLPTLPPVLKLVATRAMRKQHAEFDSEIGMGLFAAGWGWSILSWMLIGASFTTLITAIPTATVLPSWIELFPLATAAISLAMVVGFASLLPGGAGVRELILATILGVSIGSSHGLLAAIAARLMFIAVEAILAGGSWLCLRKD